MITGNKFGSSRPEFGSESANLARIDTYAIEIHLNTLYCHSAYCTLYIKLLFIRKCRRYCNGLGRIQSRAVGGGKLKLVFRAKVGSSFWQKTNSGHCTPGL